MECGFRVTSGVRLFWIWTFSFAFFFALSAKPAAAELKTETAPPAAAELKTEIGELGGASYRIDVPTPWNGSLVVYCHGYLPVPARFSEGPPPPAVQVFLNRGYAVAESGFSAGGWAIDEAVRDTEALRRHFAARHGKPKETWVTGHSLGGFVTLVLMESFPGSYDGGLALCGPLGPASRFMARRVFDFRVVFDRFFPGALPSPAAVSPDFQNNDQEVGRIRKLLEGDPAKAEELRRWSLLHSNEELATVAVFFTAILQDLVRRGGGNPFDNRNTLYQGTSDDGALNDGVTRYTAAPQAAAWLRRNYTPTGRLAKPLLAITTTYDPLIPAWVPGLYAATLDETGNGDRFVQRWVNHAGHCAITPEETDQGFADLVRWAREGRRPASRAR